MVEDKQLISCNRPIMKHKLLFSGNDIFMPANRKKIGKSYSIAFEKIIFVENDDSKDCKNYPNAEYKSYKECDDAFIRKNFPFSNMNPVWAPNLFENESSKNVFKSNYQESVMTNIFNGVTLSECPVPCKYAKVISRMVREWKTLHYSLIDLVPSSTVMVSREKFVKPPISSLMAEFGGAMGFWLGLGMVQLVQTCCMMIRNYMIWRNTQLWDS